jgi:hypothetical protein
MFRERLYISVPVQEIGHLSFENPKSIETNDGICGG